MVDVRVAYDVCEFCVGLRRLLARLDRCAVDVAELNYIARMQQDLPIDLHV